MPGRPNTMDYAIVDDEEMANESETESSENLLRGGKKRVEHRSTWTPRVRSNAAGSMLIVICVTLIVLATVRLTIWYERRGSNAPRWRPIFSPVYDMMSIRQVTKYVDVFPTPNASDPSHIFRLPPSPKVDEAWDRISAADSIFGVSALDVARAGKDPALAVDAPASWGFPEGKSKMMGIEAFHQLHCLNALRKSLITNYDYYWGWKYRFAPPAVFERHLNHCIDILRQHLMCHPDLEPFTFNWREGQFKPYADFSIQKNCIDFDNLVEWVEEHKDPRHKDRWIALKKPKGALQKEAPPGIPHVTAETVWSPDGVALANITGLEDKKYCLGT